MFLQSIMLFTASVSSQVAWLVGGAGQAHLSLLLLHLAGTAFPLSPLLSVPQTFSSCLQTIYVSQSVMSQASDVHLCLQTANLLA